MNTTVFRNQATLTLSAFALSLIPLLANAQNGAGRPGALEEVVVTAERRIENLQTVPAAISMIGAEQIEQFRITRLDDAASSVPNLIIRENTGLSNGAAIYLRGIGEDDSRIGAELAIGLYVDEVYYGKQLGAMLDLAGVESIEVLRGPQGTLYGRNANGGAVKITTRRPSDEFSAVFQAGFGNYSALNVGAMISGSLGDATVAQLGANVRTRDGYYEGPGIDQSEVGEAEAVSFLGRVIHSFANEWELDLKVDGSSDDGDPNISLGADNGYNIPGGPETPMLIGATIADVFGETDSTGASIKVSGQLGGLDFKSITGYRDTDNSMLTRLGFLYSQNTDFSAVSQEFQFSDSDGNGIDWMAGFYHYSEDAHLDSVFFIATAALDIETTSNALFGQVYIPLSDRSTLTIGGRVTDEEKDFVGTANFFGAAFAEDVVESDTFTDYRVALDYQLDEWTLFYGSVTTGTKSFGWSSDTLGFVRPEEVQTYELGLRSELLDGKLRLNVTAFLNDYQDLQLNGTTSQGFTRFNVPEVETSGLEFEGAWALQQGLRLDFSAGFLSNELTRVDEDFATVVGAGSIEDAQRLELKNSPEFSGRLAFSYERALGSGAALIAAADYAYSTEFFTLTANDLVSKRDDGGTLGARMAWRSPDDRLQISVWGRNLTDEQFVTAAAVGQVYLIAPRTYGIDARYQF